MATNTVGIDKEVEVNRKETACSAEPTTPAAVWKYCSMLLPAIWWWAMTRRWKTCSVWVPSPSSSSCANTSLCPPLVPICRTATSLRTFRPRKAASTGCTPNRKQNRARTTNNLTIRKTGGAAQHCVQAPPVSLFDFTVCRGGQSGIPCRRGCAGCWTDAYR